MLVSALTVFTISKYVCSFSCPLIFESEGRMNTFNSIASAPAFSIFFAKLVHSPAVLQFMLAIIGIFVWLLHQKSILDIYLENVVLCKIQHNFQHLCMCQIYCSFSDCQCP